MTKIHIHSDIAYFAGCENILPWLYSSIKQRSDFQLRFSCRNSETYMKRFQSICPLQVEFTPLNLQDFGESSTYPRHMPNFLVEILRRVFKLGFQNLTLMRQIILFALLFHRDKPDILHVNNGGYPGATSARAAVISAKLMRVPKIIMVVNNMALNYHSPFRLQDYLVDKIVYFCVDYFVTGSNAASKQLQKVLGDANHSKFRVIPNGIKSPSVTLLPKHRKLKFTAAAVGELTRRKGHIDLLKSISILQKKGVIDDENFELQIFGVGELEKDLRFFVEQENIATLVHFMGFSEYLEKELSRVELLIHPSICCEDMPFAIIEAMSLGIPVIGTNVAGIPELIEHEITGLIVPAGEPISLSLAISKLFMDAKTRYIFGSNSYERFENYFTIDKTVQNFYDLYEL